MRHQLFFGLLIVSVACAAVAGACGSSGGPPSLALQWSLEDGAAATVGAAETMGAAGTIGASESVKSLLVVRNNGGEGLDAVSLRFDQQQAGRLPYGITVGTVTHRSSRFEGDAQVWDLGSIEAGQAVAFPMTLWFEASTVTAEPLTVRLVMVGISPELPQDVESNVFEVAVDTRKALSR